MDSYLKLNHRYHQRMYEGDNVESFVFRPYERILRDEFGFTGSNNEKLLDYGCGSGAALQFFKSKGFDVYGVDISPKNIEVCKRKMPDIASHFMVIGPEPRELNCFFGGNFSLIVAFDSLYYYSNTDLRVCLVSLYSQMLPKAVIYATMIGTKCTYYYNNCVKFKDGLWKVEFTKGREHFINLTESEEALLNKFTIFEKKHIGFYSYRFREDKGTSFFYTFVGQKS